MIDAFGRRITYLRLSVTDRCNLRCFYCMSEDPELLPHSEVLRIEELTRLARCFIRLGVTKLRLTGGEPLVRKGIGDLIDCLGEEVALGRLPELTMTTNGIRLQSFAKKMKAAGMRRVNVSLDTLDPQLFRRITRLGEVEQVLDGIAAAKEAGLKVKINTVVLKGVNDGGIDNLIRWAGAHGHDMTLIESMPLGGLSGLTEDRYLPLEDLRQELATRWTLVPNEMNTGGPARYFTVAQTGGTLGFISPLSHGFCAECNRVRVTCTGTMTLCLGQEIGLELRDLIRQPGDDAPLEQAILAAVYKKPRGHYFTVGTIGATQAALPVSRRNRMNRTGG